MFHRNFNYTKLSIALPEFYKECIVTWALLNEDNPSSLSEIANQVIWNNRFIYNKRLVDLGIVKIGDLYDTRGKLKSNKEPLYSTLSPIEHFLLFSLLAAFPQEWCKVLKTDTISIASKTNDLFPDDFYLRIEGKRVDFRSLQSKLLYESFVSKISSTPIAQRKYGNCEEELPKKPVGRLSVNCWPTVGRLLANCGPTVGRQYVLCLRPKCWPTVGQQSADSR